MRVCSGGRGRSTGWELCSVQFVLLKFSEGIPDCTNPLAPNNALSAERRDCEAQVMKM